MNLRTKARISAVWVAIGWLGAAIPAAAQQNGPAANGPAALTAPPPTPSASPNPDPAAEDQRRNPTGPSALPETPAMVIPPATTVSSKNDRSMPDPGGRQHGNESRSLGPAPQPQTKSAPETLAADKAKTAGTGFGIGSGEIIRVLGALSVVIGLALLARIALKRAGGMWTQHGDRPSGIVEILARYPVGRGQQLMVLKLARRILLVHHSGATMSTLSEMTDADEVASLLSRMEAGSSGRSAEKFRRVLRGFEEEHDVPEVRTIRPPAQIEQSAGDAPTEIIDLTRSRFRALTGLLARKAGS